jgi:tetratricopeptide (TPR) repeat protein
MMLGRFTQAMVAVLALVLVACAGSGPRISTKEGQRLLQQGKHAEALAEFENLKKQAPENKEVRLGLGSAHFGLAEAALKAGDEATYIAELARSQDEALRAIELDPEYAAAHNLLGVISAYRSDLDAAQESFELARRLDPLNPLYYLNLAEVSVYRGKMVMARRYLAKARERGAPLPLIEMNMVLAAWREGDYVEARDIFDDVLELNPQVAKTWNGGTEITSFESMAQHCCEQVSCGPFMKSSCQEMKQTVAERTLKEETLRKEVQMELDREKRSAQARERLRDLQIEVDDLDSGIPAAGDEGEDGAKAKPSSKSKAKPKTSTTTRPKTSK